MSEKEEKAAPAVLHPEDRTLGMAFLRDTIEKYKAKLMEPGKTLGPMAVTWLLDGIVDRLCVLESMLHGDGEWRKQTRWQMVQEWLKKAEGAGVESETVTDCNGLGNVAALRKALNALLGWLDKFLDGYTPSYPFQPSLIGARSAAILALNSPPRNCDRPEVKTLEDAIRISADAAMGKQKLHDMAYNQDLFLSHWLLAPATPEKGGEE